jgi:hypothetical protein
MTAKTYLIAALLAPGAIVASVDAGDWEGHEQLLMAHPTIQEIYEIHCQHRTNNSLKPQRLNGHLCRLAQEWAEHMSSTGSFNHSNYSFSENIACGSNNSQGTMNQWINSRGHNSNLLSGESQVGFGVSRSRDGQKYWCSLHGSGHKGDYNGID